MSMRPPSRREILFYSSHMEFPRMFSGYWRQCGDDVVTNYILEYENILTRKDFWPILPKCTRE